MLKRRRINALKSALHCKKISVEKSVKKSDPNYKIQFVLATTRPLIVGLTVHYSYFYNIVQSKELNNTVLSTINRIWSILKIVSFCQL